MKMYKWLLLSAVMMLEYLEEQKIAQNIRHAVEKVIKKGKEVTSDLRLDKKVGVGTQEMGKAILNNL